MGSDGEGWGGWVRLGREGGGWGGMRRDGKELVGMREC